MREAVILSSVLKRVSIPVLHSAAALLRIAELNYTGINSFFIMELLNKKYALPYRVVSAFVRLFSVAKCISALQLPADSARAHCPGSNIMPFSVDVWAAPEAQASVSASLLVLACP